MPQSTPQWETDLRDFLRQYMETANTNAREESGNGGRTYDMRALDQMSAADMLRFVKENGIRPGSESTGWSRLGEVAIGDDDPLVQQFIEQFGERDWGDVEAPDSNNRRASGFVMGYGDPGYRGEAVDGVSILADGTRVLKLPDGRYIREEANINSDEVAGQQRADETQYRQSMQALGRVVAGPLVVGGLQAAGVIGAGTSPLGAAPGGGFGTAAGTASNLGGAVGAAGGAGTGVADIPGDLPINNTAPSGTPLDPTPNITTPGGAPGGSGAPGTPTAPPAGTPVAGAPTGGIIENTIGRVSDWYSGLSPGSRLILGTAVSQGANALAQGYAQREQQRFIEEQRDEQEADRIRRRSIPDFSGAFKPKPPGIIGSRRGG